MSTTQELLVKARELGIALAAHPSVRAHLAAQQAVRTDADARQLLYEYQAQLQHIDQLRVTQQPIEPADRQRLRDLENRMAAQESVKNLMRTQADYAALMAQVNEAIDGPLSALNAGETPA